MTQPETARLAHLTIIEQTLESVHANIARTNTALAALASTAQELSRLTSSLPPTVSHALEEFEDPDFGLKEAMNHMTDVVKCIQTTHGLLELIISATNILEVEIGMRLNTERMNQPSADILPFRN